jgi:hypothetical protein
VDQVVEAGTVVDEFHFRVDARFAFVVERFHEIFVAQVFAALVVLVAKVVVIVALAGHVFVSLGVLLT